MENAGLDSDDSLVPLRHRPFAVLGNQTDPAQWPLGIPSLWIWQIAWWIIGCFMMYLLAFKLEMSTVPTSEVESPPQDA